MKQYQMPSRQLKNVYFVVVFRRMKCCMMVIYLPGAVLSFKISCFILFPIIQVFRADPLSRKRTGGGEEKQWNISSTFPTHMAFQKHSNHSQDEQASANPSMYDADPLGPSSIIANPHFLSLLRINFVTMIVWHQHNSHKPHYPLM